MSRLLPILPLLTLIGACATTEQQHPPVLGDSGAVCNADGLADLVGKSATADLGADALKRAGARTLRWIQPGMAVTMDYRRDRLDLHLDDHNVVTRVSCG
jgi:hypothetical protein